MGVRYCLLHLFSFVRFPLHDEESLGLLFLSSSFNPVIPNEVRHLNTKKATLRQPFQFPNPNYSTSLTKRTDRAENPAGLESTIDLKHSLS